MQEYLSQIIFILKGIKIITSRACTFILNSNLVRILKELTLYINMYQRLNEEVAVTE